MKLQKIIINYNIIESIYEDDEDVIEFIHEDKNNYDNNYTKK